MPTVNILLKHVGQINACFEQKLIISPSGRGEKKADESTTRKQKNLCPRLLKSVPNLLHPGSKVKSFAVIAGRLK